MSRDEPVLSTTSYAVLGLLSLRSWTTYELAKQVQRSLRWFWPRAERKLYDEPKRLVAHGLATASKEFTGQRPRTVYDITAAGREALRRWLDEPSAPRSAEFEAMLKVFFADAGSAAQLDRVLADISADCERRIAELIAMPRSALGCESPFPGRSHIGAVTLRLQFEQERAVLAWVDWARDQVGQWRGSRDPGSWDVEAELSALVREADELLASRQA